MTGLLDAPVSPGRPPEAGTVARHVPRAPTALGGALLLGGLLMVLVVALRIGGGAPAPVTVGLPDAGPVVGWGQPVVELLVRLLAVLVTGSLLVPALLRPASPGSLPPASRRALRTAAFGAAAWAVAEVTGLVLLTGSLLGRPVTALVPGDVLAVVDALPAGRTAPVVVLLLGLVTAGALAAASRSTPTSGPTSTRSVSPGVQARVLLALALAAVVVPVATSGHPAAAEDHVATVVVLGVHVVTACLWTGGLLGLLLHVRGPGPVRARAVARLSRLALVCVVAVTATGVAGALLVGEVTAGTLLGTGWGLLLLTKTAAVLGLVAIGWLHRRRTMPLLRAGRPGAFIRLAVGETVLMAATLAVAVGLSAAPPPAAAAEPAVAAPVATPAQSPVQGPAEAPQGPAPAPVPAEDMSGHDHGELSVAVLVDDDRLHVGSPVRPGAPVTVYNTGATEVVLRAEDGGFTSVVPSRTFVTFRAPDVPGAYAFGDPEQPRYADVLQVAPPVG